MQKDEDRTLVIAVPATLRRQVLRLCGCNVLTAGSNIRPGIERLIPALEKGLFSYAPFIAASKDRIVSSGRSKRGLVGLDRSGSAA